MKSCRKIGQKGLLKALFVLAMIFIAGSRADSARLQAQTTRVYVLLEGPWILTADVGVPDGYVAIAPFMSDHTGLYVQSQTGINLSTGEYQLVLKNSTPNKTNKSIFPYNPPVTAAVIKSATSNQSGTRYAFHLPPPSVVSQETSGISQVTGETAATAKSLVIALQYDVPMNSVISIVPTGGGVDPSGNSGDPTTTPATLPYTVPLGDPAMIRIGSEPSDADMAACSDQSQKTFAALMNLLASSATVIYPPCGEDISQLVSIEHALSQQGAADVQELADVFSGKKQLGRKDFFDLVDRIQNAVNDVKDSQLDAEQKHARDEALKHIANILKSRSVPHRDCKTPIVEPSSS
jgi:hypothetical protein